MLHELEQQFYSLEPELPAAPIRLDHPVSAIRNNLLVAAWLIGLGPTHPPLKVARVAGTDIISHLTFLLLLDWIGST